MQSKYNASAYGGTNWSPRTNSHADEIGSIWARCGINSEWKPLKSVLLHAPGVELTLLSDPEAVQMLAVPDLEIVRTQHDTLAHAYRDQGVEVHYVEPDGTPSPNLIFCADLFFMTPEGAILARPASTVRAGEERWIACRLSALGIPIMCMLRGNATFEGADANWLDEKSILLGRGLRTNEIAMDQIRGLMFEMDVEVIEVDLPIGTMHLMGILRFLDKDLVITWPYRLGWRAIEALRSRGYQVLFIPDIEEASDGGALNFVTLGPREILMASGNPKTQRFLESYGVICHTIVVNELLKAAGGIGCLTGVLERVMD